MFKENYKKDNEKILPSKQLLDTLAQQMKECSKTSYAPSFHCSKQSKKSIYYSIRKATSLVACFLLLLLSFHSILFIINYNNSENETLKTAPKSNRLLKEKQENLAKEDTNMYSILDETEPSEAKSKEESSLFRSAPQKEESESGLSSSNDAASIEIFHDALTKTGAHYFSNYKLKETTEQVTYFNFNIIEDKRELKEALVLLNKAIVLPTTKQTILSPSKQALFLELLYKSTYISKDLVKERNLGLSNISNPVLITINTKEQLQLHFKYYKHGILIYLDTEEVYFELPSKENLQLWKLLEHN